jgi:hypothetical protein
MLSCLGKRVRIAGVVRVLGCLIALLKGIREIEGVTDDWSEKEACKWHDYLLAFEGWVEAMPRMEFFIGKGR